MQVTLSASAILEAAALLRSHFAQPEDNYYVRFSTEPEHSLTLFTIENQTEFVQDVITSVTL